MANKNSYYGYEDYVVQILYPALFTNGRLYTYGDYGSKNQRLLEDNGKLISEYRKEMLDHPELLDTAKKLYIHSACTFPRANIGNKFKKCLNVLAADAVIIPSPYEGNITYEDNTVVFINDEAKHIYISTFFVYRIDAETTYNRIKEAPLGTVLTKFLPPTCNLNEIPLPIKEAKLMYVGSMNYFSKEAYHVFDYITYMIPKDKIVYQDTLIKKLNDENNAPTLEIMKSAVDMLKSTDIASVAMGLKTLAALNYSDYKQSFLLTLKETVGYWRYCNARNSTAVKYMLKALGIKGTYSYIGYRDRVIKEEDYEIFEPLFKYIHGLDDIGFLHEAYSIPFMFVDEAFAWHPRLK